MPEITDPASEIRLIYSQKTIGTAILPTSVFQPLDIAKGYRKNLN